MSYDQWIGLAMIVALWWLGRKFDRMPRSQFMLNWDDDRDDASNITAHYNRHNESHLRLVKGDTVREFTPYDQQAFALDDCGFFPAVKETNPAA
jgi:hypothetical protein